jgi:asparagine N-glycosylation enzyme membrane subunit Stt3
MVTFLLLLAAAICFIVAAVWQPQPTRVNLVAAGLFFWVLSVLIPAIPK